jgi:hypothetical protein
MGVSGSAYVGTRTPRTSTSVAERSARFVRTAGVGAEAAGSYCEMSKG